MDKSVLVVIGDDWSPIAGCYGDSVVRTPRIDAFARESVVFQHAFSPASTGAVSRACLLTGLHSHTHGQYGPSHTFHGFQTHSWVPTIPSQLQKAGYATGLVGKRHFGPPELYRFDFEPPVDQRSAVDMARKTRAFLESYRDRPFFLVAASGLPHRTGDDSFHTGITHEGTPDLLYDAQRISVPRYLPNNGTTCADLADYYNAISRWDQCVGAILDELERSGRAKGTLVIVMSDHGMPFPGAKGSSYDGGHHCPLIVRVPGHENPGYRNQALLNWTDLSATIRDWCGLTWPESLRVPPAGRSVLPILGDRSPNPGQGEWEETVFSHSFHEIFSYYPYRVLRGRRFKFVHNLASELPVPLPADLWRSPTWEAVRRDDIHVLGCRARESMLHQPEEVLYDLDQDPWESRNVVEEPEFAAVVTDMRERLMRFRAETLDPWTELDYRKGRLHAAPSSVLAPA